MNKDDRLIKMKHHTGIYRVAAIVVGSLLTLAGCTSARRVHLNQAATETVHTIAYDDRSYATVLRENVKDDLVDYRHLIAHREPLDEYLSMIATTGPGSTPKRFQTPESRTCYYINAYNAAVLAAVVKASGVQATTHAISIPVSMHDYRLPDLEQEHSVAIDGQQHTLADLRAMAFDASGSSGASGGDVRVTFALCDAAISSPPLQSQPFRPFDLEEALRRVAERAMDNHAIVYVDHETQTLGLSSILTSKTEVYIDYCNRKTGADRSSMLDVVLLFANDVRRQWLNTAVGYPVKPLPFDRRLNAWAGG